MVQEHHASSLHWDVRLERGGVLVSWAVPKGLPSDVVSIRLAVRTEDHPVEYAEFEGVIPAGAYGAGVMRLWDRGRYEVVKWSDREVDVVLRGSRVDGEFVFFRRGGGRDWMVKRRGVPARPGWVVLPGFVAPMRAVSGVLPEGGGWGFEFRWSGVRVVARVEGGRLRLVSGSGVDVTGSFPGLRGLGPSLGATEVLLDGVVVSPPALVVFDVLHLDGVSTVGLSYERRRALVEGLGLAGSAWVTPRWFAGGGSAVVAAAREHGVWGVVAKRVGSVYSPGVVSGEWVEVRVG
ncbi:DNA polymerase ligase N-terminal domain-containing protein [Actinosynnema sp. NPDC020468]|uniref:DNA polymerase ligase N-terminal domain-containing protein n=1 Tax=Actinosynnema sp. NPDC020468 TaxID=3154488 RepID=UPI0033FDFF7A